MISCALKSGGLGDPVKDGVLVTVVFSGCCFRDNEHAAMKALYIWSFKRKENYAKIKGW